MLFPLSIEVGSQRTAVNPPMFPPADGFFLDGFTFFGHLWMKLTGWTTYPLVMTNIAIENHHL